MKHSKGGVGNDLDPDKTIIIKKGGLVIRVTGKEKTRRLRAADNAEYRKRCQRNIGARATRYGS